MNKSVETSSQFKLLPRYVQDLINQDIMDNPDSQDGAAPFSFAMGPSASNPVATQGTVFKDDAPDYKGTVGPLTRTDIGPASAPTKSAPEPVGALSKAAPHAVNRAEPDFAEMLAKYAPQDDSSAKYLAMAAALGRPTGFGSFGESMSNVADALLEQKNNQQKLRAQYTPLIMQHIAAQQARDEQAAYRMEAQQQAQQAQAALAQQNNTARADQNALTQQAAKERHEADRSSREAISADRAAAASAAKSADGKPPAGYVWGPGGTDGNPTMIAVKGGPADTKLNGVLNADTQALSGATANFDRLSLAANQVLMHPGLPGITGMMGKLPNVPGGEAADAQALLETLKSQVGFGVLQDMRNSSKTGGALGAVSEKELAMLQSNLAALDKAQSLAQFQQGLRSIMDYAEKAKGRMREAYNLKHSDGAPDAAPAPTGNPAMPGLPSADAIAAEIARRKKG